MGDLKIVSTSFSACETKKTNRKACQVTVCVQESQKPVVDCLKYTKSKDAYILANDHSVKLQQSLSEKFPKFSITQNQIIEYVAINQLLDAKLLDKSSLKSAGVTEFKDLNHPDNPYRHLLMIKNFLLFGNVDPKDQSSIESRGELIASLFYLEKKYPQLAKLFDETYQAAKEKKYFMPNALSRLDWISAALLTRTGLLNEFKDYIEKAAALKPTIKRMAQEIVRVLLSGKDLSKLENEAFFHAVESFQDSIGFGEDEAGIFIGKIIEVVGFSFPGLVEGKHGGELAARGIAASQVYQRMIDEKVIELYLKAKTQPEVAFKESLSLQYNGSPEKKRILGIISEHLKVTPGKLGMPVYQLDMETIYEDVVSGADQASTRSKYLAAVNEFLVLLFARDTKFRAFWNGQYREVESFHKILGAGLNRYYWGELIHWVRDEVDSEGAIAYPVRLLGLSGDAVFALAGGGALAGALALENKQLGNAGWLMLGAGLGGALGNLTCFGLDFSNDYFLCDIVGGLVVGSLSLYLGDQYLNPLIYEKPDGMKPVDSSMNNNNNIMMPNNNPGNNQMMPGMRRPVDPFGP